MQAPPAASSDSGADGGSLSPPATSASASVSDRRKIVIRVRRPAASPSPSPSPPAPVDDHSAAASSPIVQAVPSTAAAAVEAWASGDQTQSVAASARLIDAQPVASVSVSPPPPVPSATPDATPSPQSDPSIQEESQIKEAAALLVATVAQHAAHTAAASAAATGAAAVPARRGSSRPTSAAPTRCTTAPTAAPAAAATWARPTSARRACSASLRTASPSPARAPSASPEPPNPASRGASSSSTRSGRSHSTRPPAWEGAKNKSKKELDADSAFLSVEAVQAQWNEAQAAAAAAVPGSAGAAAASLEASRWGHALRALRSVCLIRLPSGKCGTGFLFADGYIMTNAHVIETAEEARHAKILFFFDAERDCTPAVLSLAPKELFIASPRVLFTLPDAEHLDYAVIKLAPGPPRTGGNAPPASSSAVSDDAPGVVDLSSSDALGVGLSALHRSHWQQVSDVDPLELSSADPAVRDTVCVVQHPLGRAKQVHLGEVTKGNGKHFTRYRADTSYGSSGSPVISWTTGAVVALHHKSVCEDSQLPRGENQGVLMSAIVADLNVRSVGLLKLWTWNRTCAEALDVDEVCHWMLEYGDSAQFQRQACLLLYKLHAHRASKTLPAASASSVPSQGACLEHVDSALFFAIALAMKRHRSDSSLQQVARAALHAIVHAAPVAPSQRPVVGVALCSPQARASPTASPTASSSPAPFTWPAATAACSPVAPSSDDVVDLSRGAPGFKLNVTSLFPTAPYALPFKWRFPSAAAEAAPTPTAAAAAASLSSNPYCCSNAVARFNAADRNLASMIQWAQTTWLIFLLTVVGTAYAPSRRRLLALADPLDFKAPRKDEADDTLQPIVSPLSPPPEPPPAERALTEAQNEEAASAYVALQVQTHLSTRLSRESAARASLQARVASLEQALSRQTSQLALAEQERAELGAELEAATTARRKAQADLKSERALSSSLTEQIGLLKSAAEAERLRRERAVSESKALEMKRRADVRTEQVEKEQIKSSVEQLTEQVQALRAWKTNAQRLQKRSDKIIQRLDRRLKQSLRCATRYRHLFRRAATLVMAKHLLSRRQLQQATATLQSLRPQLEAEVDASAQATTPNHQQQLQQHESGTLAFWQSSPRATKTSNANIASAAAAAAPPSVSPFQRCLGALFGPRCAQDGVRDLTAAVLAWNVLGVQVLGALRAERAARSKADAHASTLKDHVRTLALEIASTKRAQAAAQTKVEELESSAKHAAVHHATTVRRLQDEHSNHDMHWQREVHSLQQQLHAQQQKYGRGPLSAVADLRDAALPVSSDRALFVSHRQHHPSNSTVPPRAMSAHAASEEKQSHSSSASGSTGASSLPLRSHSPPHAGPQQSSKLRSSLLASAPSFGPGPADLLEADEQSTPVVTGAGGEGGAGLAGGGGGGGGGRGKRARHHALRQSRTFASQVEQRLANSNALLRSAVRDVKQLARSSTVLPPSAQMLFGATAPLRPQPPPSR